MLGAMLSSITGVLADRLPTAATDFTSSGPVAFVVLFLLVWLMLWTLGGYAAMTHLARTLAGEDIFTLQGSGVEVVRRAGPFRKVYTLDRPALRRVRVRPHDKAVVADTKDGTQVLTDFGSPREREEIGEWLIRHLALPDADAVTPGALPATWELTTDADSLRLRKVQPRVRMVRAVIAWVLAGGAFYAWYASLGARPLSGDLATLVLALLLGLGAALSTWGRREWIVRSRELRFRWSVAAWTSEQTFAGARLDVEHSTDSDNDHHYKLVVTDGARKKTIHSQIHDSGEVVDLGKWLASRTGFPLTLAHELRPRRPAGLTDEEMRLPDKAP